jgi:hypothetical protein
VTNYCPEPEGELSGSSFIGLGLCYLMVLELNEASFEHIALDLRFQKKEISTFSFVNAAETRYTNILLNFRNVQKAASNKCTR